MKFININKALNIYGLLFILLIFANCTQNKEEVELKVNIEDNFEASYELTELTKGSMINVELKKEVKLILNTKNENSYLLDANLISVYSKTNFGDETEIYDSKNSISSMSASQLSIHKNYKTLLDSTVTFELNNTGKLINDLKYKNGQVVNSTLIDFNNFQIIYPTSKVKIGSTWERTWQNNALKQGTIKANYKITEITPNTIEIKATQKLSSGTSKIGKYIIDRKTGIIITLKLTTELQMGGTLTTTISKIEQ